MLNRLHCTLYYILHVDIIQPPLWSRGQSSTLQTQRSGFNSRRYQIFWEIVGLERGPLSLVSTTEELLGRKSSSSGLEIREYGRRDPSRWPLDTLYLSVGIVRSPTQAKEFSFSFFFVKILPSLAEKTRYTGSKGCWLIRVLCVAYLHAVS
jgi:hypothetical protein